MKLLEVLVRNPVKVAVGVLLVILFGLISLDRMPIQLIPEVQTPTISIRTRWPGASPQEFEQEIIEQQEEYLRSVEGLTKMSSSSYGPQGRISLEFAIGTNMNEALLKVNSQLQQVPDYPETVDEPVITTSNFADEPIAWFTLGPRPPSEEEFAAFAAEHPELAEPLESVRTAHNSGLAMMRLRELVEQNPTYESLLPKQQNIIALRRFVEDSIEAAFERVEGVARSDVHGGLEDELQVIVDPYKLAARDVTIFDVRDAIRGLNENLPAGYFDEGKRRWFVRTLGQFETPEQVEQALLDVGDGGAPLYVGDVAEVRLGLKDPAGLVRRFGESAIGVSVIRETGANVLDVMEGLREVTEKLNAGPLDQQGLYLTQIYDETEYIYASLDLVQSNIFIGGALTMIVLMAFLHLSGRTLLAIPLILGSAAAATYLTPWMFVLTLVLVVVAGVWFARATLVAGLVIPTSIIGTFLMMNLFGRSLNVISLAGIAFAVGMLVDNAIVVMESIYRRQHELGEPPLTAAVRGTREVWGAVLASSLTSVAIFLPVVFVEQEAGQLFRDIALAISAALVLSLIVSTTVIPTATIRLFHTPAAHNPAAHNPPAHRRGEQALGAGNGEAVNGEAVNGEAVTSDFESGPPPAGPAGGIVRGIQSFGRGWVALVVGLNRWLQAGVLRQLALVGALVGAAIGLSYLLWPEAEYLPTGNRNQIIGTIRPPQGYNYDEMMRLGQQLEENLRPYWDVAAGEVEDEDAPPAIDDFFYVVDTFRVFISVRARDPERAVELLPLIRDAGADLPGTTITSQQTSLFEQGRSGGRTIELEISGPDLEKLESMGQQVLDTLADAEPETPGMQPLIPGTQTRANPELGATSPEIHVRPRSFRTRQNDLSTTELGYTIDAMVDGAYAADYFLDGDKIDLMIRGEDRYAESAEALRDAVIATPSAEVVPLGAVATVEMTAGPEQIDHREGMRAITVDVTPPQSIALQDAMRKIELGIIAPLEASGQLNGPYRIDLGGTADKLRQAWEALRFNLVLALLITYLLMAGLFESWLYPLVIILSVPLGAVGGVLGLRALNLYLGALDSWGIGSGQVQQLDVLTMLGFVILIGTVVNNPILIVHQSIQHIRDDGMTRQRAILESTRSRIRPIFMTTVTTLFGLLPLVLFPGAGSELYRGLGSVLLGGLLVSTIFTLFLVPTLLSLTLAAQEKLMGLFRRSAIPKPTPAPRTAEPLPEPAPTPKPAEVG
ncbi:efflux RND transporter permease subunit [Candidatus Laterigemmans baculatus]|uniref:efflux RND transporter permease subunit n=1 Tax=Candidatus Laterigemmans baculatus TaxID=2770505 RepID=UPI0013DC864C|nr:efflux RND transporter permease subunit [Candidatus Laterigemmans baculatus]